jgi:hypothetical protein
LDTIAVGNETMYYGNKRRQKEGAKGRSSEVTKVRVAKFRLENKDGAADGKEAGEGPVNYLQLRVADEGVVGQGNAGSPQEEDDALEIELHAEVADLVAVAREGVEPREAE